VNAYTEAPRRDLNVETLARVPIQHGGRIKPLDTFAREVAQTVTGRSAFQGISAVEMIFSWMFLPEQWSDVAFIEIQSLELKKKFNLSLHQKHYSAIEILKRENINQEFQNVYAKSLRDEKLSPYDEAVQRLSAQLLLVESVSSGGADHNHSAS